MCVPVLGNEANSTELDVRVAGTQLEHSFELGTFRNNLGMIYLSTDEEEEDIVVFGCAQHNPV